MATPHDADNPMGDDEHQTTLTARVRSTLGVDFGRGRRRGGGPSHPARTAKRKEGEKLTRQALASYELGRMSTDRAPEENVRGEMV
jgi:hypothetical protein